MSLGDALGLGGRRKAEGRGEAPYPEYLLVQRPLRRVLAFTGRSIDDVVNDPIAKNIVLGYYKLYCQVQRASEVVDLERDWNPQGARAV